MATVAFGDEPRVNAFYRQPRGAAGLFYVGAKQVVVLIGPTASTIVLPPLDPRKVTHAYLYTVPDAMRTLSAITLTAQLTGVISSGASLNDADVIELITLHPELEALALCSQVSVGKDELVDLTPKEIELLGRPLLSEAAFRAIGSAVKLKYLQISGYEFQSQNLDFLSRLQNLKDLRLQKTEINDQHFEMLAEIAGLESLYLDEAPLTGREIYRLSRLHNLKMLSVRETKLSHEFAEYLSTYLTQLPKPRLEVVNVSGAGLSAADLESVSDSAPFTRVETYHRDLRELIPPKEATAQATRECRAACDLTQQYSRAAFGGERNSDGKVLLTRAQFERDGILLEDWLIPWVGLMKNLLELRIANARLSNEGLARLDELSDLEFLSLGDSPMLTDDAASGIGRLPALKGVYLRGAEITDAGVESLCKCRSLVALVLDETAIGDAGAESIAKLPQIQYVSLKGGTITDEGAQALLSVSNIKRCDLRGNPISSRDLKLRMYELEVAALKEPSPKEFSVAE